MPPVERRTARLTLRALHPADIDALFEIQGDPDWMRYTFCATSRAESNEWLERYERSRAANGFAPWVAARTSDGLVIGWGGLSIDPLAPKWGIEVSYFVSRAAAGSGFASEIVRAALDHAFDDLGIDRVRAFARPENAASLRVLAKYGFRFVRHEPELERHHYEVMRGTKR